MATTGIISVYLALLLFAHLTPSFGVAPHTCGPEGKCKCVISKSGKETMKCSNLILNVSDVCSYVSKEPRITRLDLSKNTIKTLENNDFVGCERIEKLDLSSCGIIMIELEALAKLINLKWLDLAINRDLGFESLNNISYGLQFTKIDFLNISALHHKFGLGMILRRQHICYLRNTTLREIAIDSNRIQQLEINVLLLFPPTLQILHVNDNLFMFGPYFTQLACLNNLTTFTLNYRNRDPSVWGYLSDPVIKTDCIYPFPSYCPFDNEHYLRNISTDYCKYHEKNRVSIFDLYDYKIPKKLKTFTLKNGNFDASSLNVGINDSVTLEIEYLDASGNHLTQWNHGFVNLSKVKYADLSRNGCDDVKIDFFTSMPNVEHLDLCQNFLGYLLSKDEEGMVFKPLKRLRYLDLSSNQIQSLTQKIFIYLIRLQTLKLRHNGISTWTMDVSLQNQLNVINISSNSLHELPKSLTIHLSHLNNSNFTLDLTDNPLQVSCSHKSFLQWIVHQRSHLPGFENYSFQDDNGDRLPLVKVLDTIDNFDKTCRSYSLVIILCSFGLAVFLSVVICGVIYRNRWKLRYFMYMNRNRLFRYKRLDDESTDAEYMYDAFISYADKERRFIKDEVTKNVENTQTGLKLCIHDRDFIGGQYVAENILNAIQNSRKTVIILSKSFLKSRWCRYEFEMARMESLYKRGGRSCVIMVLFEYVPLSKMTSEMADVVKNNNYVEYTDDEDGNALFWNKLIVAIKD